jgi:hypothetical protein
MKFQRYVPKKHPLHCVVIGKQGAGKSSLLGSLAREPMLLLYNASGEAHSPDWVAKAADEVYQDAKSENVFPVRVDECEAGDSDLFQSILGDKVKFTVKVGEKLSADQAWIKLKACLEYARTSGTFKSVSLDSFSSLAPIIRGTAQWQNFCKTEKGAHNNFKETDAYIDMYREIVAEFNALKDAGIHSVATCLAKPLFDATGQEDSSIAPVLPMFGVVEQVIPLFMDICVMATVDGKPALDFGVKAYKASKDQTGKMKKYINIEPRLNCAPTGLHLEAVYPDLWYIDDIVKAVEAQAKQVE